MGKKENSAKTNNSLLKFTIGKEVQQTFKNYVWLLYSSCEWILKCVGFLQCL
jgi:hypothetical protein